jgi:aldose 1-epimerase
MTLLTLSSGPMRVDIAPETGGALHGWHHGQTSLLRPVMPGADGQITVRELASYPLIPFSNRIAQGQFNFDGTPYTLARDKRETRHALHGNALYAAWRIAESAAARATLRLASTPERQDMPFFPFPYEAEQIYEVTETSLRITLRLTNHGTKRFPAGFGHHLYFPRHPESLVQFQAGKMWENGQDGLPSTATAAWRAALAQGRMLDETSFDNCFEGWAGEARLSYPSQGYSLRITASPAFGHAVFFTPPGKPFFAFEPVTHLNDAVNRSTQTNSHGLKILEPEETMEGWITLAFTAS